MICPKCKHTDTRVLDSRDTHEQKEIRRLWHNEEWYFSVIDVIGVLTDSVNARDYWFKMKIRYLLDEIIV